MNRPVPDLATPRDTHAIAGGTARPSAPKRSFASRLFGYDVFISFALGPPPRGTHSYASDLARRLRELDYSVFFSEDEAPPGEQLDRALRDGLLNSKTLVVIANRGTLKEPRWVRKEVEEYRKQRPDRPVIIISAGGALQDPTLEESTKEWLDYQDKIWLDESEETVSTGIASESIVHRLATAPSRAKSNVKWRWAVRSVITLLVVMAIGLGIAAKMANDQRKNAEERARVAEVERMRALSAQNFAEHERVRGRTQTQGVDEDEKKALEAIAPKYLEQSKRYAEKSKRLQNELDDWRREQGVQAATPDALFTLEVFRAESGSAFLLHYGVPHSSRHILIDGGSRQTYRNVLKPRFEALSSGAKGLPLSLLVSTQTDMQQMGGLIRLIEDLHNQQSANPFVTIDTLWSNAFVPGPPEMAPELVSLQPKGGLAAGAKALRVPVNAPFKRMVAAPEAGVARVSLDEHLTITILSPRVQWLRRFADFWLSDWRKRAERRDANPQLLEALNDYDILETFADPKIELLPSPIEIVDIPATAGRLADASVVNLASTVLMLELNGKRMLLTADARSDVILGALAQAGYTDERGIVEVDLLVLPHGGSDRNLTVDFFRRVKASHYILSADGTFTNPKVRTFEMLFEARRGDSKPFSIALTYEPEEYKKGYPVQDLCDLLAHERSVGTPFEIVTPKKDQNSFGIDLWSNATFVDKGTRNALCGRGR